MTRWWLKVARYPVYKGITAGGGANLRGWIHAALVNRASGGHDKSSLYLIHCTRTINRSDELLVTGQVFFEGEKIPCQKDKTLLQNLQDHGVVLPFGCCQGRCGACKLQASGTAKIPEQITLMPSERGKSLLVCSAFPPQEGDLHLSEPIVATRYEGVISAKTLLSEGVLRIAIKGPGRWQAGQFVSLYRDTGASRCYSFANPPKSSHLIGAHEKEFHIRLRENGELSQWLNQCDLGDLLEYGLAQGQAWEPESDFPIILVGTGTGIAPLLAIAKAQLQSFPRTPIFCFWAMPNRVSFYCWQQWLELMKNHSDVLCVPVVRKEYLNNSDSEQQILSSDIREIKQCLFNGNKTSPPAVWCGDLQSALKRIIRPLARKMTIQNGRVALAGNSATLEALSRWFFLLGVSKARIHVDAFDPPSG